MKISKILAMAWENLKQKKLRTSLTTLGVVIGITTIIGIASLGEGFRTEVRQRMEQGFELDVLIVFPGSFTAGLTEGFSKTDVENITQIDNVTAVTPLITIPTAELYNETGVKLGAFTVGAVNFTEMKEILPLRFRLANGDFPQPNENQSIVLGYKASRVNETLVADVRDNVALIVESGGSVIYSGNFTVTGVLEKGGTSGITNFDYWAFIPIETALEMPFFEGKLEPYQIILVKVSDTQYSEPVAKEIEKLFPPYSITVFVPSALMRQVDNILNIVQIFLVAIGSISLLVAGVGIMNIMTVAVMERTREIGILKAIGAKSRTVLGMFLAEAIIIGVIGGFIGTFTGYGLSYALAQILSNFMQLQSQETVLQAPETQRMVVNPVFSPEWTIIAIVFAIIVCIIFGLYPARKAAKLNPVEALRYE
ncbi:MAG: ABC transporter permease [Candidatus Bathyarchaeota archaeon]|nr:ABC transporter permease [Candidatus Bathyarchaeota archaeon]